MEIKKYLKAMPVMAALLLTASCSNEDNEIVESPQPEQVRTVPITVTASSASLTRATLDDYTQYMFDKDDHLYVWSEDKKVYGELEYNSGYYQDGEYTIKDDPHEATFKGDLTITSGGELTNGTTKLYAVIKSKKDQILGTLEDFKENGFKPDYTLAKTFATSNEEAVQMFSFFIADATYSGDNTSFNFNEKQNSAFLSFDVTLEDGASAGDVSATIKNGEATLQSGTVAAAADVSGKVHAKFVAGFPSGTELYNATVTVGSRPAINFGSTISSAKTTLAANKIYRVSKDYNGYKITASASVGGNAVVTDKPVASGILLSESEPYNKTIKDILKGTAAEQYISSVTSCVYASGDENVSVSGDAPNFTFSAKDQGTSTFTVMSGNTPVSLSITVSKLISPNLSDLP